MIMKMLLSLLLSLYLPVSMFGQNVALANDRMNVAYADIPNPITIAVENYKAAQVIVSTDNGTFVNKGNGHYNYVPVKAGKAIIKIEIKTKSGIKEIGQTIYKIKAFPLPNAGIGWIRGGQISKILLLSQKGIIAQYDNFDFDAVLKVSRFKITTMRNGVITFNRNIFSNRFDADVLEAFQTLIAGDYLFVSEIYCTFPDKKERRLEPIEFTILP
jgi:hypothetical protein